VALGKSWSSSVPSNWGPVHEKEARKVPVCERHLSIAEARSLMGSFIGSVLRAIARQANGIRNH